MKRGREVAGRHAHVCFMFFTISLILVMKIEFRCSKNISNNITSDLRHFFNAVIEKLIEFLKISPKAEIFAKIWNQMRTLAPDSQIPISGFSDPHLRECACTWYMKCMYIIHVCISHTCIYISSLDMFLFQISWILRSWYSGFLIFWFPAIPNQEIIKIDILVDLEQEEHKQSIEDTCKTW